MKILGKPTYREMARAVERAAGQATDMAIMIAAGQAIGPKPADIERGAVDVIREAECLTAAALELASLVRVLDGNIATIKRRKAG